MPTNPTDPQGQNIPPQQAAAESDTASKIEPLINLAIMAGKENNWPQAKALYEMAYKDAPDNPAITNGLGITNMALGDPGKAAEWYGKTLEIAGRAHDKDFGDAVKIASDGLAMAAGAQQKQPAPDTSDAKAATPFVYHGTSQTITGDSLIPSGRATERADGSHTPVVYANSNLKGAYAYALKTEDTLVTDAIGDQPYTIIKDKEKFEREFKGGTIYKFPSALFEPSMPKTDASSIDEWTSRNPVPLAAAAETIKVPDVDTALRDGGVKVFYLTDPAQAKDVGDAFNAAMQQDGPNHTEARTKLMNQMLAAGVLTSAEARQAAAPDAQSEPEAPKGTPAWAKAAAAAAAAASATAIVNHYSRQPKETVTTETTTVKHKTSILGAGLKAAGWAFGVGAFAAVATVGLMAPIVAVLAVASIASTLLGRAQEKADNYRLTHPDTQTVVSRVTRGSDEPELQQQVRSDGKSWAQATAPSSAKAPPQPRGDKSWAQQAAQEPTPEQTAARC